MSKSIKEERLRWVIPIIKKQIKLKDMSKVCPYSKRTLERWVATYKKGGEDGLVPQSTRPKTSPKETSIRIKERIVELRKKKRYCALKLRKDLAHEDIYLHVRTIGKIIKREGLTRKYRKKKVKYKYIKATLRPGELMEIDVKYVPGKIAGRRYYQYTAIDCASRWRYLAIYENQSNFHSISFLQEVIKRFPYPLKAIKTDNGAIFTNYYLGGNKRSDLTIKTVHALDQFCAKQNILHYLIDPGKPAQNGKVERSHRSDQGSFYDQNTFSSSLDLKRKLRIWNNEYNNLYHCALECRTPNEFLENYKLTEPPNVCA